MSLDVVTLFIVTGAVVLVVMFTALILWATRSRSPIDQDQSRHPYDTWK